jgi:hypothetical protein
MVASNSHSADCSVGFCLSHSVRSPEISALGFNSEITHLSTGGKAAGSCSPPLTLTSCRGLDSLELFIRICMARSLGGCKENARV